MDVLMADSIHLHGCVELLKKEMERNTVVTEQVRDILASFRIVGAIAKWCAAIGAAATALYHGWLFFRR